MASPTDKCKLPHSLVMSLARQFGAVYNGCLMAHKQRWEAAS